MTALLDDTAVVLPRAVRWIFAGLSILFAALVWWLVGMDAEKGWLGLAAVILACAVGAVLLVSAVRGRMPKWLWLGPFFVSS